MSCLILGREGETRKRAFSLTNRQSVVCIVDIRDDLTRYSQCGEGSGPNRPMLKIIAHVKAIKYLGVVVPRGKDFKLSLFADCGFC